MGGVLGWKAWFVSPDGDQGAIKVYNSTKYRWTDLPAEGVLAIKVFERREWKPGHHYAVVYSGGDWYYPDMKRPGYFDLVPTFPEWGQWAPRPEDMDPALVKRAGVVEHAAFDELMQQVMTSEWP